jgi:hypothetical protein
MPIEKKQFLSAFDDTISVAILLVGKNHLCSFSPAWNVEAFGTR